MPKVIAKHPIRHDGKLHPRGTKLALSEKDAQSLAASGFVEPIEDAGEEEISAPHGLEGRTKQQLVDYARESFKLTLDVSSSKAGIIQAIIEAQKSATNEGTAQ